MIYRPYQDQAINQVQTGWHEYSRQLLVLPTGAGKTVVFSAIADQQQGRSLILAHRDELVNQAIDKLFKVTGVRAGKEKAQDRARFSDRFVVASVQTMARRLKRWPSNHFQLIICDEAHRSASAQWQKVIEHFAPFNRLLGVTATPDRADQVSLGETYERVAFEIGLFDLIKQGYLVPIKVRTCPLKLDLKKVGRRAGDFAVDDVGHALEPYLPQIAQEIRRAVGSRRLLCFLPLVKTSHKFCAALAEEGLSVRHIDGGSEDREKILEDFAAGKFQVLSNAMLLTEGFDDPGISAVCNLRVTQSRSLYTQMVGRGTRLSPETGKEDLLLIDFLWQAEKHNLVKPANLMPGDDTVQAVMSKIAEEKTTGGDDSAIDLFDLEEEASGAERERERTLVKAFEANKNRKSEVLSAEDFCARCGSEDDFEEEFPWQGKRVTENQAALLKKAGVDLRTVRNQGHASALIDTWTNFKNNQPASHKQIAAMKRAGYPGAENATAKDARAFFARRNGNRSYR